MAIAIVEVVPEPEPGAGGSHPERRVRCCVDPGCRSGPPIGDAGRVSDDETGLYDLIARRRLGVLATIKRDGRPQLSSVNHVLDPRRRIIQVSIRDRLAKTANLRRDPRASFHVASEDGWSYAVAEATARLGTVARDPQDASVEDLIVLYRQASGGEHPDWDDFRHAMVREQRLVLTLTVERVYGLLR